MDTDISQAFDPFTYTHGRWLDRDHERRKARELHFDFDALLNLAVKCSPGARQVLDCKKKEGGFNRVFMILLDNGRTVVARLPVQIAGPATLTVSSEVATIELVRDRTSVPVPRVLSWGSGTDNAVGAEYIIMDEVPGVLLKDVWNNMKASQHIQCIRSLGELSVQLWTLSFPSFGSLYFYTSSPSNAVRLDDTFSIGPLCAPHHWDCGTKDKFNVNTFTSSPGPWHSLEAYLSGFISEAQSSALANAKKQWQQAITYSRSACRDFRYRAEPLSHPDFHTRNIFVDPTDPTRITGIIDWQWAAIEPAFMLTAETPDIAQELPHDGRPSGNADANTNELSPQAKIRADAKFCADAWAIMSHICSETRAAYLMDSTLNSFLAAGSNGWLKDPVTTRLILLELHQKWTELGLPGQSFYQPRGEETEELERQSDTAKTSNGLQEHLSRLLGCDTDGWIPVEKWEEVLPIYREEYRRSVTAHTDEGGAGNEAKATREADQIWPFDQR
ncbi:hypothetical protein LTR62_000376 [Meristemomyces frigidus]|uniref:Altered inheritance of mitochondria protein 9, mitochondrial n=1 Tax=Meristemomyces frigidus TaxID=1508187 RepID=A0AAN7TTT1_9PEZI|nr:hypothetical protein LTR62_000376 [Meristemomyces frigidus]